VRDAAPAGTGGCVPVLPVHEPIVPRLTDGQAIKLIGLGGVGSIVARYGSMFLAPLTGDDCSARLVLIDGDSFTPSNSTRMFFGECGNKATTVRNDLLPYFADSRLEITAVQEYVTPRNIQRLLHDGDIIVAAVDNHATRRMLNDFVERRLKRAVLISGGNDGIGADARGRFLRGTWGTCQTFIRRDGKNASPSLTEFHPEIEHPADKLPSELSCIDLAASVPQFLLANLMTAASILNSLWLYLSGVLHFSEIGFDIADGLMRPLPVPAPVFSVPRTH
jgi:hypothetical protein